MYKVTPLWKIKLLIDGIWLNDSTIKVSNELLIRSPNNLDFEIIQQVNSLTPSYIGGHHADTCSAIIEISKKFDNETQIEVYLTKLMLALRLYNLGSVHIKKRDYFPNSILMRYSIPYHNDIFSDYSYELNPAESNDLMMFTDFMLKFLPERNWQNQITALNPIYISIDRYCDALTKNQTHENKITNAITALEALLLKGNERSELSHKLSQRVAYLSRFFNAPPIKVYNTMKRAYEVRSTYIHGSMLSIDERKDLSELQKLILEALRRSLLIFIELSSQINKDDIIAKIDNAIIDSNAHKKFSVEISKLDVLRITANNTGFKIT